MKPSDLMSYATVASQGYYNFVSDRGRKKVTQNTLWLQVSKVSQGQMHIEHVTGGGEKHKERDFRESTFTHSEGKKKALTRMTSITKKHQWHIVGFPLESPEKIRLYLLCSITNKSSLGFC